MKSKATGSLLGLSLDTSHVVLSTLRDVGRIAPVPFLLEAAQLALGILSTIQAIKDCEEGFERLARDSCILVYAICRVQSDIAAIPEEMNGYIEELLKELKSISEFANKRLKSKRIFKIIRSSSDRGKILEYREALRHSLDVFTVQSSITGQKSMSRIERRQEDIALQQRTRDSEHRLLLEEIRNILHSEETQPPLPTVAPLTQPAHRSESPPRNPQLQPQDAPHTDAPEPSPHLELPWRASSDFGPRYHITGDYITNDNSLHIRNAGSNNTTTTHVIGSNNNSSARTFADRRGTRHRAR